MTTDGAKEITFDPSSPGTQTTSTIGSSGDLGGLACSSPTSCVTLVGTTAETFDPQAPVAAPYVRLGLDSDDYYAPTVACTSATQCFASQYGQVVAFDPAPGSKPTVYPVNLSAGLNELACPSMTQCTAVGLNGTEMTFDPGSPGSPETVTVDSDTALNAVACPAADQCTAVDDNGGEVTFNPASPGPPGGVSVDSFYDKLNAISCPSTGQCTAVDAAGNEVTFDPASPRSPTPVSIDATSVLTGISCPSTTQCTAVDTGGAEVTFDPHSTGAPTAVTIDTGNGSNGSNSLAAIACPSASQCTAVDGGGGEVTFDPQAPGSVARTAVGSDLTSVSCPTTGFCVAAALLVSDLVYEGDPTTGAWTEDSDPLDFDHDDTSVASVACASASLCVLVDIFGEGSVGTPASSSSGGGGSGGSGSGSGGGGSGGSGSGSGGSGSGGSGSGGSGSGGSGSGGSGSTTTTTAGVTTSTGPTAAQIARALDGALAAIDGKDARIGALLKDAGYRLTFSSPGAGRLTISWYTTVKHRQTLIATVTARYSKAERTTLEIALNATGKKLLRTAQRLTITDKDSFTPTGHRATTVTKTITLKR